jgi:hypothetical protein
MPLPPSFWSEREIDRHWEDGHMLIAREIARLHSVRAAYLELERLARQCKEYFGGIEHYDREIILGSLHMLLTEDDNVIALIDGLWLPGLTTFPYGLSKKRIPVNAPYFRRLCQNAWQKTLAHPSMIGAYKQPQRITNNSLRFRVFKRDGYRCQICGATAAEGVILEVDHRHPKSRGGTNTMENLWTLCFACNRGKHDDSL